MRGYLRVGTWLVLTAIIQGAVSFGYVSVGNDRASWTRAGHNTRGVVPSCCTNPTVGLLSLPTVLRADAFRGDVAEAFWLVEENAEYLREQWSTYHD